MDDALDAALRFLSYRPRSEAEVRRRLARRFPGPSVDNAIATLREQGLLDDAAFAQFWRQNRERSRPKGASAMKWELLRMGVSREVADDALEGLDEDENAYRAASGYPEGSPRRAAGWASRTTMPSGRSWSRTFAGGGSGRRPQEGPSGGCGASYRTRLTAIYMARATDSSKKIEVTIAQAINIMTRMTASATLAPAVTASPVPRFRLEARLTASPTK